MFFAVGVTKADHYCEIQGLGINAYRIEISGKFSKLK